MYYRVLCVSHIRTYVHIICNRVNLRIQWIFNVFVGILLIYIWNELKISLKVKWRVRWTEMKLEQLNPLAPKAFILRPQLWPPNSFYTFSLITTNTRWNWSLKLPWTINLICRVIVRLTHILTLGTRLLVILAIKYYLNTNH